MKRCSKSLAIKEVQIKAAVRYRVICIKMATIKTKDKITSVAEDVGKLEPLYTIVQNVKCHSCYGKQYDVSSKN